MDPLLEEAEALQNLLISVATGGSEANAEYTRLRQTLLSAPLIDAYIPRFVRTCRSVAQFWQFIKYEYGTYAERREFIWDGFRPLMDALERGISAPSDSIVTTVIDAYDSAHIQAAWSKALDRRNADPEGAITVARTLLESVCRHILEDAGQAPADITDLTKLYKATAEVLNVAPSQHSELVFKQILGGCTAVVEGLGALRNRLSDSHGKGRVGVKPAARHAEFAVNLAGATAVFLIATWEARRESVT